MQQVNKQIDGDYDSEDDSHPNESIDEISFDKSGEVLNNEGDAADTKSRASLQNLRSKPELIPGQDTTDVKSLMSGGKGNKTTTAAKSPKYSHNQKSGLD